MNPVENISAEFVSDYVKLCRENGIGVDPMEVVDQWLDTIDAPPNIPEETRAALVAQVNYYLH
jgi:hypothetical protein